MVARGRPASGGQQVLDHQLQPDFALIFVGGQAIHQPQPTGRERRRTLRIDTVEGDGLKSAPPFASCNLKL